MRLPSRFGQKPRSSARLSVALLVLAIALATTLAYQAWQAERRHRATVEGVLRNYAETAAWHFVSGVYYDLFTVPRAFASVAGLQLDRRSALPPLSAIIPTAARFAQCADQAADQERFYFRLDLRDRSLITAGREPARAVQTLVVTTVGQRLEGAEPQSWYQSPRFRLTESGPRALIYVALRDQTQKPMAVYGFETCNPAIWEWVFRRVMRNPLLPPVLTGNLPSDSLFSVDVAATGLFTAHYRSAIQYPARFSAEVVDKVDPENRGLVRVRLAIRPDLAGRLVIGGLPRSRLPLLLGLLGVTAGVFLVALMQLRRERELLRIRADFTSSVSHELRTPLAEILLFAETLEMERVPDAPGRAKAIRIIAREARRLTQLVNNVLQFSRAERHVLRLDKEPVRLSPALRGIVEAFAPVASLHGASIDLDLDDRILLSVHRGALDQIVVNLLDNAVKYGPRGQTIMLRSRLQEDWARVEIEDQGSAIPPSQRERIWEPFTRLYDANLGVTGSGIGLAVVRQLVEAHRGRCRVESGSGGGSRFIVEFPAAAAAEDA